MAPVEGATRTNARSLAAWLRAWSDPELVELVRRRPDLVVPVPADVAVLAQRAAERLHVARALDGLDRFTLQVLDAVLLLDAPVSPAAITDVLGADPTGALDRLRGLALVWGEPAVTAASGVAGVVERPAGLGRPAAVLLRRTDRSLVAAMLAAHRLGGTGDIDEAAGRLARALPAAALASAPEERAVLDAVDAGGGVGQVSRAYAVANPSDRSPVRRLLARGLLVPLDMDTVELPREVGLALRGPAWLPPAEPEPPRLEASGGRIRDPDATGALAAADAVRLVELLLEAWARTPPGELKTTGLGQRDLRAAARTLGTAEATAALFIETARAAGLVGRTTALDGGFAPTAAYDAWLRLDVAHRWQQLAAGWLTAPVAPGVVGRRDDRDRVVAALSAQAYVPSIRDIRRTVLTVLADAPAGVAPTRDSLRARLAWLAPRRGGHSREVLAEQALDEAALLGVAAAGAMTAAGRALLHDAAGTAPAAALTAALPAQVEHLLLQGDLTAIAPGPLPPELARDMAVLADIESPGSATVYRFSEGTLRRALDTGWTAAEIHALLDRVGRPGVPQGLAYLVDDVARRHGLLRAGSATSYLRCDDEALIAAVLSDRRCEGLQLRRIAPTILVSSTPVAKVLAGLRSAGYAPVGERPDGSVVLSGRAQERATRGFAPAFADGSGLDRKSAARIVASLRAGDRAATVTTPLLGAARELGVSATLGLLEQAMSEGRLVLLGYVNAQGQDSRRIVEPERLAGGLLTAYDQKTQERRSFALHRITDATLLDDMEA